MVKLLENEIETKEVLGWKGIHLIHAAVSSCSQKTRIFLNLKGINWTSHLIDIENGENHQPWFLGVSARGLVPVLIDNGDVHIESNDILLYLEEKFPNPQLLPKATEDLAKELLDIEDEMHLDLRALTFRYLVPRKHDYVKNPISLTKLEARKSTLGGKVDKQKNIELAFWNAANTNGGITDKQVAAAAEKFVKAFNDLDKMLANKLYILGEVISVVDIAWFIYANRVMMTGYPLHIHKHMQRWFDTLKTHEAFAREIFVPPHIAKAQKEQINRLAANKDSLEQFVRKFMSTNNQEEYKVS